MKHPKIKSIFSILAFLSLCLTSSGAEGVFAKTKVEKKQAATSVPTIYPRASWSSASDEKRTKSVWPAEIATPEVIIIHHTATNYKGATSKQIKKIYRYHSYTRKWGDIGYNYIIGKDGAIFEGRYGGNGVVGGHSYFKGTNYNKGSIGIAVLGNYVGETLTPEARDSLQKLVGWLAATNGITIGENYKFFSKKLSARVIGHKDVADTACPGKNIYNNLQEMRSAATSHSGSYQNFAYQVSGESEKFEISAGKRYSGSAKSSVAAISKTQLEAYALAGEIAGDDSSGGNYPSGTLFENESSGQKGLLENGSVRPIGSEAVLTENFNSANFVKISAEKWAEYPSGGAVGFRDGSFLKDEAENYYIIGEGKKKLIALPEEEKKGIDFQRARSVSEAELAAYPDGENISSAKNFPAGTVITTGNRNYFQIQSGGIKKKISKKVFSSGFSSEMTVKVSQKLAKSYKTRGGLAFQNGAAVNYRNKYFFIENGARRQFSPKNLAGSMGYKNITKAKKTEMTGIGEGAKIE